jgi:hypothetical protein
VCVQQSLDVEEGEWEPNLNCLSSPFSRVPKVVYAQILLCFQLTRRTFYRQTQQKKKDVERRTVVVHIYIYIFSLFLSRMPKASLYMYPFNCQKHAS